MSRAPFYGDRPVASWRFDPYEGDALSYTLGVWRRAQPQRDRCAPPPAHRALVSIAVVDPRQLDLFATATPKTEERETPPQRKDRP